MMLTARRARAAILVAEDELTNDDIAAEVGVTARSLTTWKNQAEFQVAVQSHVERLATDLSRFRIARKAYRVAMYDDVVAKLYDVLAARATDKTLIDSHGNPVPGAETGMLVRTFKETASGKLIAEYAVDTGTLAEMRAVAKQAAVEAGQWTEKQAVSGEILVRRYVGVDPDDV